MTTKSEGGQDRQNGAQGEWAAQYLWPRPPHPLLRQLNLRRALRRRRIRRAVRYEFYGPPITEGAATATRSITLWHRDLPGGPIGKVSYLICHSCRIGYIGNIDVQKSLWGNGIATEVLAYLRLQLPGYMWQTSRHYPTAKSFWLLIADRTGESYSDTQAGHVCSHIARFWNSGRRRTGPPELGK